MTITDEQIRSLRAQHQVREGSTHWDGCESDHPSCAIASMCDELLRLRDEMQDSKDEAALRNDVAHLESSLDRLVSVVAQASYSVGIGETMTPEERVIKMADQLLCLKQAWSIGPMQKCSQCARPAVKLGFCNTCLSKFMVQNDADSHAKTKLATAHKQLHKAMLLLSKAPPILTEECAVGECDCERARFAREIDAYLGQLGDRS